MSRTNKLILLSIVSVLSVIFVKSVILVPLLLIIGVCYILNGWRKCDVEADKVDRFMRIASIVIGAFMIVSVIAGLLMGMLKIS